MRQTIWRRRLLRVHLREERLRGYWCCLERAAVVLEETSVVKLPASEAAVMWSAIEGVPVTLVNAH
jgi:hypothetical protein